MIRLVLAATLSSVYGIYNGFELCEATPIPGKEEYLNSEKYEYKVWDWDRPGNIKDFVTRVNKIRPREPGTARTRQPAFLSGRRRQHPVLRQDDAGPVEHGVYRRQP